MQLLYIFVQNKIKQKFSLKMKYHFINFKFRFEKIANQIERKSLCKQSILTEIMNSEEILALFEMDKDGMILLHGKFHCKGLNAVSSLLLSPSLYQLCSLLSRVVIFQKEWEHYCKNTSLPNSL